MSGGTRRRGLSAALAIVFASALMFAPQAAAARFSAYVAGAASGPGHRFFVGDGLNLVFQDKGHSNTRYRVCVHGPQSRCRWRDTGARGARSSIFIAAPGLTGGYEATWSVRDRVVARWRFSIGAGD